MPCHRCQSLMFPIDLLDGSGGLVHQCDTAWRCFACGDIIDDVIAENRARTARGDIDERSPAPRPRKLVGASR